MPHNVNCKHFQCGGDILQIFKFNNLNINQTDRHTPLAGMKGVFKVSERMFSRDRPKALTLYVTVNCITMETPVERKGWWKSGWKQGKAETQTIKREGLRNPSGNQTGQKGAEAYRVETERWHPRPNHEYWWAGNPDSQTGRLISGT